MYWIYLIIFIVAVLSPDIIRNNFYFLSQTRTEEMLIFLLGTVGFLLFLWQEHQLSLQKKEKRRTQKKIDQTTKDLIESYSYIGEVNRKMDILMNIALGVADKISLSKEREASIYRTIIDAAKFLMKGDCASIKFFDTRNNLIQKEINEQKCSCKVKKSEFLKFKISLGVKKAGRVMIFSSHQGIKDICCFLLVRDCFEQEPKTLEIMKVLASQALFVYSYARKIE